MDDLPTEVVRLAIQAAGPIGGNPAGWLHRITELTPRVASLLRPPLQGQENDPTVLSVTARKVLEATVFKAEYVDHYDDPPKAGNKPSQRLIARFKSDTTNANEREDDGTEHLRTEPMWSAAGRLMRSVLDTLQPGQQVMVYKSMEGFEGTDEKGRAMKKNSRVLVHLVALGKPPASQNQGRASTVDPGTAPEPQTGPGPAARSETAGASAPPAVSRPSSTEVPPEEPHGQWYTQVQERLEPLTATQKVAWKMLCRGRGVTNFIDPESESDFNKVILAFEEVTKKGTE